MPGRIETAAALVLFLLLCLWLIAQRSELPDNGDLIMIAVCIWAAIRLVSEDFRRQPADLFRYTSCGTVLLCAAIWSVRRAMITGTYIRTAAELGAIGICIAVNLLTTTHVLSAGSEIADFAVKTGSAAMMLLLTLMTGGDLRKILRKMPPAEQRAPSEDTRVITKI